MVKKNTFLKIGMTVNDVLSLEIIKPKVKLPDLPNEYLDITLIESDEEQVEEIKQNLPFAITDINVENVVNAERLTYGKNVKEIYLFELSNSSSTDFKPGDTIGILTQNRKEDVEELFNHLKISHLASKKCKISQKLNSKKKIPLKPSYLDKITTLEIIFTEFVDIYCVPKKLLIRILAEYTKNETEKSYLQKLCSQEGADLYIKEVLNANRSFLDLLLMSKSCCPPIARLLENLPPLLPRPYSIASSPLASPNKIKIIFSVIKLPNDYVKEGLCTGMLKSMTKQKFSNEIKVKMFFRKCNGFNLPESEVPIILIGPGTGIAPFIGFLEHRKLEQKKGYIWLFYGCRYETQDYLFKKELQEFLDSKVLTKLSVAFSRGCNENIKYVQDNIVKNGQKLTELIFNEKAIIYVCGDGKNMQKDIFNAFVDICQKYKGMTNEEALDFLKTLQKEKRYRQDLWI